MRHWSTRLAAVACLALAAFAAAPAGAQQTQFYSPTGDPYAAPYAGVPNYANFAPQFRWGWFGAQSFRQEPHWHRDYYGRTMSWQRLGPTW